MLITDGTVVGEPCSQGGSCYVNNSKCEWNNGSSSCECMTGYQVSGTNKGCVRIPGNNQFEPPHLYNQQFVYARTKAQISRNCTADERLCFCYKDSSTRLLKFETGILLICLCGCTCLLVSNLFGNPDFWFSHTKAVSLLFVRDEGQDHF